VTREAVATRDPQPSISEEVAAKAKASSVRVRFLIASDGSFEVVLLDSSGSREVDEAVLSTARRWRWKPALRDGLPLASSPKVRFFIRR